MSNLTLAHPEGGSGGERALTDGAAGQLAKAL